MFGSNKIKLDKELLAKVKRYSDIAGYSSPEEFITHALEKELAKFEGADSEEEIKKLIDLIHMDLLIHDLEKEANTHDV